MPYDNLAYRLPGAGNHVLPDSTAWCAKTPLRLLSGSRGHSFGTLIYIRPLLPNRHNREATCKILFLWAIEVRHCGRLLANRRRENDITFFTADRNSFRFSSFVTEC
jgi:hypothetical protein